jgi:hypothetical protein
MDAILRRVQFVEMRFAKYESLSKSMTFVNVFLRDEGGGLDIHPKPHKTDSILVLRNDPDFARTF